MPCILHLPVTRQWTFQKQSCPNAPVILWGLLEVLTVIFPQQVRNSRVRRTKSPSMMRKAPARYPAEVNSRWGRHKA